MSSETNEKQCRICFSGPEEEAELGRLISPCKCKGSMKYVHLTCLNQWRLRSAKESSFFQCDQCKYKYNLSRTLYAQYLTHPATIATVTIFILLTIIFIAGFISKLYIIWAYPPLDYMSHEEQFFYASDQLRIIEPFFENVQLMNIDIYHFMSGGALVGLFGCMGFIFNIITAPGIYRRHGRRDDIFVLIVAIMVMVGLYKVGVATYKWVQIRATVALAFVENKILDVDVD